MNELRNISVFDCFLDGEHRYVVKDLHRDSVTFWVDPPIRFAWELRDGSITNAWSKACSKVNTVTITWQTLATQLAFHRLGYEWVAREIGPTRANRL